MFWVWGEALEEIYEIENVDSEGGKFMSQIAPDGFPEQKKC